MKKDSLIILWIFLFFSSVFILTGRGYILPADGEQTYLATEAIIQRLDLRIGSGILRDSVPNSYAPGGLGYPLINIPIFLIGKIFSIFLSNLPKEFLLRFFYSFSNSLITSLLCILIYKFSYQLINLRGISFLIALLFGLATMVWHYAKDVSSLMPSTLFLTLTLYLLFKAETQKKWLFFSGLSLGYAIFTRIENIIILPILLGYIIFVSYKKEHRRQLDILSSNLIIFLLPIIFFILLIFCHNKIRYNSFFTFTGGKTLGFTAGDIKPSTVNILFTTPLKIGLYGLLFSSGRSFFLYSPILILFFWGFVHMYKKYKKEAILILTIICTFIITYAKYRFWTGGGPSWGPRPLMNIIPFFILPIGFFVKNIFLNKRRFATFMFIILIVISVFIQILAITISPELYAEQTIALKISEDSVNFIPKYSPLLANWKNLFHLKVTPIKYESLDFQTIHNPEFKFEFLMSPDLWWIYFYRLNLPRIYIPIVIILIVLILFSLKKIIKEIRYE